MKTPEQLAAEHVKKLWQDSGTEFERMACECDFLAGYQAAKDEYKVAIDTYNDVAKQMLEEAVRIMSPKDQLADADKVMCNTTMEEVKAVDTGELMPITNLPTSAKWISVKERLPEYDVDVLTFETGDYKVNAVSEYTQWWCDSNEGFERNPTHWMPLPEAPKEKK